MAEQIGHHPGAGLQGADLALVPGALAPRVGVQGADRPAGQLHRHAQRGPEARAQQRRGDLLGALAGDVADRYRRALPERIRAGALREVFLGLFQLLGLLVGGGRPAQRPLGVDQHQAHAVDAEQVLGHGGQLQHAWNQPPVQVDLVKCAKGRGERGRLDPHGVPFTSWRPGWGRRESTRTRSRRR
jgi:hypothetical protein